MCDFDDDSAAFELAFQVGPRLWQPKIEATGHLAADAQLGVQGDV